MRRGSGISHVGSVAGMVAGLFIVGTAWASPGVVLSNQKISDTVNFPGTPLDNLDEFGGATAFLGDLDGAGPSVAAVAVGASLDDDGGGDRGAVYILFLNASGTVLSSQKISDTVNFPGSPLDNLDEFGGTIAFLGDLDGAGPSVGAIAVGAGFDDDGGADRGAVYILFLSASGTVLSAQKISSTVNLPAPVVLDNLDEFGGSVTSLGDLDGAGPSSLAIAVGASGDDDGGGTGGRGAVYILFLNSSGTVLSSQKISDTVNFPGSPLDDGDDFGTAVQGLGDLDGAGPSVQALAVGAGFDDDGGIDRGAVYILFLDASGTVLSSQKISDLSGNFTEFFSDYDEFGGALSAMGDMDGAGGGVATLAVGVAGDDDNGEDHGAVHILFLNSDGTCHASQKISDLYGGFTPPLHLSDYFGGSVAFLGDLDGAGPSFAALAVGVTGDDDGGTDRGATFILFLDGTPVQYTLTYLAGSNGSISGTTPQVASQGGSGTEVTAVPNSGYVFNDWSDGVLTASRTDSNITADLTVTAHFRAVVGVGPLPELPPGAVLGRASPNPSRAGTTIPFRLEQAADVRIDIWGLDGRLVRQLVRAHMPPGDHQAEWDGRDDDGRVLSNGAYFYRMAIDGRAVSGAGKVLLLH
jgi:List-Bact-rpt repeat protein/flagellar hook capping protein FlgD